MRTPSSIKRRRQARGVALIEALVGLLIFAFGVLGLIGLQATMTKASTGAKFRADAANLGNELLGLIWSDAVANLGKYTTTGCASHAPCADWKRKLESQMPSAQFTLTQTSIPGTKSVTSQFALTIEWTQPDEGTHRFETAATVAMPLP